MTGDDESPALSVVVVTHNEADRIEACLESVFEACRAVESFEVVLVDSNSTDRTVELATGYPVTVLRIPDDELTTPGAGRYVGTQYVDGDAVLFVDGDMVLTDDWLPAAIEALEEDGVAAVDGHLDDVPSSATVREVDSVRGVALYDAEALDSVGGFDPQLEAVEDIHLGFELGAAGHRLLRLPIVAAHHPERDTLSEPLRRWRLGYARGNGQAIRKSLTSPRLLSKHLYRTRFRFGVGAWCGVGVASLATGTGVFVWLALSAVAFAVVARNRGGLTDGFAWTYYKLTLLVGLVIGLFDDPKPRGWFPMDRVETVAEAPVHHGSGPLADD